MLIGAGYIQDEEACATRSTDFLVNQFYDYKSYGIVLGYPKKELQWRL